VLRAVFNRPLALSFAALWFVGFLISETAAIVAFRRIGSSASLPFVIPAIALFVLSVWTAWRHPWALAVGTALGGLQIVGAIGCAIELHSGIAAMKAAELLALGVDPRVGVEVNLAYSLVASALFLWAVVRFVRR
jgi:hypothetical protein